MQETESGSVQVLIAEDDRISRRALEVALSSWGYDPTAHSDGSSALRALQANDGPRLAILDWMMPGLQGVDVCRKLRETPPSTPPYLILLTSRGSTRDVVLALEAGADDHVTKPFEPAELRARVQVGERILSLQRSLAERVRELEDALARVKHLHGLLPICMYCRKVREGKSYWRAIESYVEQHTNAQFTHGICPACYVSHVAKDAEDPPSAEDLKGPFAG